MDFIKSWYRAVYWRERSRCPADQLLTHEMMNAMTVFWRAVRSYEKMAR
jgi:hypothetical protein